MLIAIGIGIVIGMGAYWFWIMWGLGRELGRQRRRHD